MHTFFLGWRKKVGIITLIVACMLTGAWLRSLVRIDYAVVRLFSFRSGNGGLFWERTVSTDPAFQPPASGFCYDSYLMRRQGNGEILFPADDPDNLPRWRFLGFGSGEYGIVISRAHGLPAEIFKERYWRFPYWAIVLPVTLLSSFLLLAKSRESTSRATGF